MVTLSDAELDMMLRLNVSLLSNMLSLVILTSNRILVLPAGNITLYGPGS